MKKKKLMLAVCLIISLIFSTGCSSTSEDEMLEFFADRAENFEMMTIVTLNIPNSQGIRKIMKPEISKSEAMFSKLLKIRMMTIQHCC